MLFHISWTTRRMKLVDPSSRLQKLVSYGRSKIYIYTTRQLDVPRKLLFRFIGVFYDEIWTVSKLWQLYILLNCLTIQNDRATQVFNTIYTSRTMENKRKWKFKTFFLTTISGFFSKLDSLNIHANRIE